MACNGTRCSVQPTAGVARKVTIVPVGPDGGRNFSLRFVTAAVMLNFIKTDCGSRSMKNTVVISIPQKDAERGAYAVSLRAVTRQSTPRTQETEITFVYLRPPRPPRRREHLTRHH